MENFVDIAGLLLIVAGSLVFCFFGYRFFRALLSLAGGIIFASLGWWGSLHFLPEQQWICMIIAVVASFFGAWLFHKLFKLAAFLYGAAAGIALTPVIVPLIDSPAEWLKWGIPVICGLTGGLLLLISKRIILIAMTAGSGSLTFTNAVFVLLLRYEVIEETALSKPNSVHISMWSLVFLIMAIGGFIYQFKDKSSVD